MTQLENVSSILQINILLYSLILGVIYSVIFTFYNSVIILFNKSVKNIILCIFDILFILFCAVSLHLFSLVYSFGKVRLFSVCGVLLGFFIAKLSIGKILSVFICFFINSILIKYFLLVFSIFKNGFAKIYRFFRIYCKKIKHFFKKPQKVVKNT